jgi:hypothetical protein
VLLAVHFGHIEGDMDLLSDNVVKILQGGVIGLGFLLAVLASVRLSQEQKREQVRPEAISGIKWFMVFSITLCLIGLFAQLWSIPKPSPGPTNIVGYYWQPQGTGDYGDMDILQATSGDRPSESNCNEPNLGLSAVCWPGGGCRYKQILSRAITPTSGNNPGNVYRCTARLVQQ